MPTYNDSKNVEEREIDLLRNAVDKIESRSGKKVAQSPEVKKIIGCVERFLREKKLVCYGGTAINSILPEKYRFYNNDIEVPDYDFYSPNALEDSKELADIFFNMGYNEVESKSGSHPGTFKVFVNFIPVADITHMEPALFSVLAAKSYIKHGIRYAPTNFLRMAMYLELSRPEGDVSRWEKVLKRLTLLNKVYPMKLVNCSRFEMEMQNPNNRNNANPNETRMPESKSSSNSSSKSNSNSNSNYKRVDKKIYDITQKVLMNSSVVFIGGFADILYSKYLPKNDRHKLSKQPEFDVLSNNPEELAKLIKLTLKTNGFDKITIEKMPAIGEIILDHYKVAVDSNIVALIYKPTACHSYNTIKLNTQIIKVASIDTMLMFYLAFSYAKRYYYNRDRLLCLAGILFYIQNKNRLSQSGLLKRFGSSCYGKQETIESLRRDKATKYQELKNDKSNPEYQRLFLRYVPFERAKTHVQKLRRRKSQIKRKKMSVRNRLPSRRRSLSRSRSPSFSHSIENIDISPIEMNSIVDNASTANDNNDKDMKTEPVTYAVNSEALSRLKTKTVSISKPKHGSKNKTKTTKRKRNA
jgi:hypothetical protein